MLSFGWIVMKRKFFAGKKRDKKKLLIAFPLLGLYMLLFFNILYWLPELGISMSITYVIYGLFLLSFGFVYVKLFGVSLFKLRQNNFSHLLKSCGLCTTLFVLLLPFQYASISTVGTPEYLIYNNLIEISWTSYSLPFLIATLLIAPITEEIVYRGLLEEYFLQRKKVWLAILLPALLFALAHQRLSDVHIYIIIGCVLGFIYYRYRNLSINILCHHLGNVLVLLFDRGESPSLSFIGIYLISLFLFVLLFRKIKKRQTNRSLIL